MTKIDSMISFAVNIANDNRHGYSQYNRWGPDYDCSSLVITAAEKAGYPVRRYGATYTGNMYNAFIKAGFKDATRSVNLRTGAGLKKGDVLLNHKYHTELYIGNGRLVGANSDEYGGIAGRNQGDQTGREIYVKPYYYYSSGWDVVLRPPQEKQASRPANANILATATLAKHVIRGEYGNGEARKQKLYNTIQGEVNNILAGKQRGDYITAIAKDVIKGVYGNGEARKENIYKEVQRQVNKII